MNQLRRDASHSPVDPTLALGEMQMASEVTLSGPQGTLVCKQLSLLLRLICVTSTECVEHCVMSCPLPISTTKL